MSTLSEEQVLLRDTVRGFVADRIAPLAESIDHTATFPDDLVLELAEMGLFGIPLGEDDGGAGFDMGTAAMVVEELARGCPALAWTIAAHTAYALRPVALFGSPTQKERCLSDLADGRKLGGLAAGEPHGDFMAPHASSSREGESFRIRGRKGLVTNGSRRGWLLVACEEEQRRSVFLVDGSEESVRPEPAAPMMGLRGADCVFVDFDTLASADDRLAEPERLMERARDEGRVLAAAVCLGIIEECLARAAAYAQERRAFGKAIATFQEIRFKLANMKMAVSATRGLLHRAVALADAGSDELPTAAASAKLFAARAAIDSAKDAIQILGGNGYTAEYAVERLYRDAMVSDLIAGPSQAQKALLADACFKD